MEKQMAKNIQNNFREEKELQQDIPTQKLTSYICIVIKIV